MQTDSKYDFARKEHDFYFEHGGERFDLWRNVVCCFADTYNFHVSINAANGEHFDIGRRPILFDEVIPSLMVIKTRLENCGYLFDVCDSEVDPLGFQMDMIQYLVKIEAPLLHEALAKFDNENPTVAPVING